VINEKLSKISIALKNSNSVSFRCRNSISGISYLSSIAIKPMAYSLILLRVEGYPCIFYGDLFDVGGVHPSPPACDGRLPNLVLARKLYAYGEQEDDFTSPNCIGMITFISLFFSPLTCAPHFKNLPIPHDQCLPYHG
jgi:hypothetical protein